jgi:hypothetical protein
MGLDNLDMCVRGWMIKRGVHRILRPIEVYVITNKEVHA